MADPMISLLMGSDSDLPTVKEATKVLTSFGIPFEVRVLSAHRSPEDLAAYVKQAEQARRARVYRGGGGSGSPGGGGGGPYHSAGALAFPFRRAP